jgi:hypothetical protein
LNRKLISRDWHHLPRYVWGKFEIFHILIFDSSENDLSLAWQYLKSLVCPFSFEGLLEFEAVIKKIAKSARGLPLVESHFPFVFAIVLGPKGYERVSSLFEHHLI